MSNRFRGHGATWFKKRSLSRRLNAESRTVDERDVGGLRLDLAALLGETVEPFPEYDLDAELARRHFQSRARAWLTRAA